MFETCLKFTTVDELGGSRTSSTQYVRGRSSRSEWNDGRLRACIRCLESGLNFFLDVDARVYTTHRPKYAGQPLEHSGYVTQITSETIDTGDRQEMFGYVARHVISRSTTTPDPASGQEPHESEIEGWYIDPPAAWLKLYPAKPGARCFLSAHVRGRGVDEFKVSHTGPNETGFPLITTRTSRSRFRDRDGSLREHQSTHRSEVTEFSEADLDPVLFLPPRDFRRVLQLPGEHPYPPALRWRMRWEMLRDLLAGF